MVERKQKRNNLREKNKETHGERERDVKKQIYIERDRRCSNLELQFKLIPALKMIVTFLATHKKCLGGRFCNLFSTGLVFFVRLNHCYLLTCICTMPWWRGLVVSSPPAAEEISYGS
jgi:hypothetical protein